MIGPNSVYVRPTVMFASLSLLEALLPLCLPAHATEIAILYTGETHSMLAPCDCPIAPEGGVARRAHVIQSVRRGGLTPTLLLDAGGMFAGGVYDEYTQGENVDRERTLVNLHTVATMGYDAIAAGDEELAWGVDFLRQARDILRTPLLSANVRLKPGGPGLLQPYVIREAGGKRFGIVGLTTQEQFCYDNLRLPVGVQVDDPLQTAATVVAALRPQVDFIVVLSHLGEEQSRELAESVSGIDILVNGHRRSPDSGLYDEVGNTIFLQFSYQGRAIGRLDLILDDEGKLEDYRVREIRLGDSVPDDPVLALEVAEFDRRLQTDLGPKIRAKVDLYVMSDCPFGQSADRSVRNAWLEFGRDKVEVRRRFIARLDEKGEIRSLHGAPEVEEDLRQLCIEQLYGERLWDYACTRAARPGEAWDAVARAVGMELQPIAACLEQGLVGEILVGHIGRTERLRVDASPTIYINNRRLEGEPTRNSILRGLCNAFPERIRPEICQTVPECDTNSDCAKPGKIGTCENGGTPGAKCVFTDPAKVLMMVLTSQEVLFAETRATLDFLATLVPGLEVEYVDRASPAGQALEQQMQVRAMPAYFLDNTLEQSPNFEALRRDLVPRERWYQLGPRLARPTLRLDRERREGHLDLFLPALGERSLGYASEIIRAAGKPSAKQRLSLDLHWLCFRGEQGHLEAPGGRFELEEAARQAAVWMHFPEHIVDYLAARAAAGGTGYWQDPLERAGLDPQKVRQAAQSDQVRDRLLADADLARQAGITQGLSLLYANQEVVAVVTPQQLTSVMDRLGINDRVLTVLYSSSLNGTLRACGCPGNPFGSVARMAALTKSVREAMPNALLLDAGDLLPPAGEEPDFGRATYMLKVASAMKYDAVAVGDQEFSLGPQFFRAMVAGKVAPFICSNVTWKDGEPVAAPYRILTPGGMRVGVIALLCERAMEVTPQATEAIVIEDPTAAARRIVGDIRDKVDILIALSHQTRNETQALALAVPEIDIIIAGHTGLSLKRPKLVGKTWLVQAGRDAEQMGRLSITLDLARRISVDGALRTLDETVNEDREVAAIIAEYQRNIEEVFAAQQVALPKDPLSSTEECGRCHAQQLAQWEGTTHATAAATLAKDGRAHDPECWRCHSTKPLAAGHADIPNVSCVACHRVKQPTPTGHEKVVEPVSVSLCLPCHTRGRSPHFDYEPYLARVTH